MSKVDEIKAAFPWATFGLPVSEEEITKAEIRLGVVFPPWLREMYLAFNGFREPKGDAQYLFPLTSNPGGLVEVTEFMRTWEKPDFTSFVFFGSSISDEFWAFHRDRPRQIICYQHLMEDEYEIAGDNLLEIYLADFKK